MKPKITSPTDNVFEDLGFPKEEAENLRIRSLLMLEVRKVIESRGLSQTAAAKLFGVTQPRISDLKRGKIELFSIDTLINMLSVAGATVHIEVKQEPVSIAEQPEREDGVGKESWHRDV